MAKGQQRSNREKKKPKQDKTKIMVSNSPFAAYYVPSPPASVRPAPLGPRSSLPYTLALSLMALLFGLVAIAKMI